MSHVDYSRKFQSKKILDKKIQVSIRYFKIIYLKNMKYKQSFKKQADIDFRYCISLSWRLNQLDIFSKLFYFYIIISDLCPIFWIQKFFSLFYFLYFFSNNDNNNNNFIKMQMI